MTAGLPGTGIGGLFYFLMALMMPLREVFFLLRGKSSLRRWGLISLQCSFVGAILACMWGEMWLINYALNLLGHAVHRPLALHQNLTVTQAGAMGLVAAQASLITLGFVFCLVHLIRLWVFRRTWLGALRWPTRKLRPAQALERVA